MSGRMALSVRSSTGLASKCSTSASLPAPKAWAAAGLTQRPSSIRRRQPCVVVASSYEGRWPDPQFIQETKMQYEGLGMYAKPLANPEEARVLLAQLKYVWLDVRSPVEVENNGKVPGSVNIPYFNAKKRFDPEQNKSVMETSVNTNFMKEVQTRFPKKEEVLLLVADANGRSGAQEALTMLEDAGYLNLVGMVGGFYAYWRVFDAKGQRRPSRGAFVEDPWSNGASQGMFAGES